ncbi:hypothetical protein HC891_14150 [Candidatus Gracilibacteria bacterium]|nr:hypothetical protein [Candidatus Gracilibacteria bacterium]
MFRRPPILRLLLLCLFLAIPHLTLPARAAEPGAEVLNVSATLSADTPTITTLVYDTGPMNLRLQVSGGEPGDIVTLTLRSNANQPLQSWRARSGETIWGNATLPSGSQFVVQNGGTSTLNVSLQVYARGTITELAEGDSAWQGVALGRWCR